jgi:hypothetical protein
VIAVAAAVLVDLLLGLSIRFFFFTSSLSRNFELIYLHFMRSCSIRFFWTISRSLTLSRRCCVKPGEYFGTPQVTLGQPLHYLCIRLAHQCVACHDFIPHAILHGQRPFSSPTPRSMLVKKEFSAKMAPREEFRSFRQIHSVPIPDYPCDAQDKKNTERI